MRATPIEQAASAQPGLIAAPAASVSAPVVASGVGTLAALSLRRLPLRRFLREGRAVALIEFSLIAPFLILFFLSGFELTRYLGSLRKLTYVGDSIAQMMAQNTTGSVNANDIAFMTDSTMLIFPDVLADSYAKGLNWSSDIAVTISSVKFTPTVAGCTSNCIYTAKTAFSVGTNKRPCNLNLQAAADNATPSTTTLPTDVYGPGTLIVVDVAYNYVPAVAANMMGTKSIRRSTYLQPRYVSAVTYDTSYGSAGVQICL